MRLLSIAFLLASTAVIAAEPKTLVDVTGIADGTYLLIIDGGTVTLHPCRVLVPDAPDPPDPPNPDLTERGEAMRDAALSVQEPNRDETAKLLATLYREIDKGIKAGTFKTEPVIRQAVQQTQTMLLTQRGVLDEWKPTRDLLAEQWADVLQRGGSDADYGLLLVEDAAGFEAAAPDSLDIDIELILAIIKWFIENILPLII